MNGMTMGKENAEYVTNDCFVGFTPQTISGDDNNMKYMSTLICNVVMYFLHTSNKSFSIIRNGKCNNCTFHKTIFNNGSVSEQYTV